RRRHVLLHSFPTRRSSDLFLVLSLVLGLIIHVSFSSMLLVYSLVSMAYSHPAIRIKKYPYGSWLIAGFFQGCFTLVMAYSGLTGDRKSTRLNSSHVKISDA